MIKHTTLILIVCFLSSIGFSQSLDEHLMAHWTFDGTLGNALSTSSDGTANGGSYYLDRFGRHQSAYQFTSRYDYILLDQPLGPYTNWVVSFWVLVYSDQGAGSVITRDGNENYLAVTRPGFKENVNRNTHTWNGHQESQNVKSSDMINQWRHCVFQSDGAKIHLYLDGEYKGARIPESTELNIGYIGHLEMIITSH